MTVQHVEEITLIDVNIKRMLDRQPNLNNVDNTNISNSELKMR